ncbi:restriction endonuclease subunit S [Treponema succinifaciens]|uniref:restriction endonuclease subunit S n=1 Tax=Treponema succinifaciens TaxID=167 RepID=UPI003FF00836
MKNSGVEWIGEIPENWEVKRGKELFFEINDRCKNPENYPLLSVSEYYGVAPKSEKIDEGDFITHAETLDGYKICQEGDIVQNIMLAWKRATGMSNYEGLISPAYCIYRPFKGVDSKYYHYLFRTDVYADLFKQFSTGIIDSRLRLYPAKFLSLKYAYPPKSTQQRIASYLDKKCSKIEETIQKQQQVIEKLKAYKQSLITEAVTGKIKIQNGKVCGKYESYKDSGVEWIGKIPTEWEVGKTGMFTYVTKLAGFEFTDIMMDKISENGDVPIVRAQNVRMFKFNKEIINEYIDLSTSNTLNRCCLDKKCLLITFIGAGIGDICIFDESIRYHLAPNVAKIEIRNFAKTKLCEEFLMYYIGSEPGKREIANISKVAAQPSLSMETIRKIKLCIPPFEEQKLIVDYLYPKCLSIDKTIEQKQELIVKLTEYKKSLIYECVTGKKEI